MKQCNRAIAWEWVRVVEQLNQQFFLFFAERSSRSFFGHGFAFFSSSKRIPLPYLHS
jgi:hypothetical protein